MSVPQRDRPDACPGVLATHQAADGGLVRVRFPAGRVSARQLRAVATCADRHGDGVLYLTSRANAQLRGLTQEAESVVAATLSRYGLLPRPEHERVRNYLASPASGYFGGCVDVRSMITALDDAVCARPGLAALPGRFLFGLDDGRGDVSGMDVDVCWQAAGCAGTLIIGGVDTGLHVDPADAVHVLIRSAEEFLAIRGDAWRLRELPGAIRSITAAIGRSVDDVPMDREPACAPQDRGPSVGFSEQRDGRTAIVAAPVFGELTTEQARAVAAESGELVVTPWRTVLVPDIASGDADAVLRRFADAGLGVDPDATWLGVSSCIGMPACAKAHADVRGRARQLLPLLPTGTRAHFSGCERRCGKPNEPHTDVLATADGYRLDGAWVPAESLEKSLIRPTPERTWRKG